MVMVVMSVFSVTRAKYCSESSVTSRLLAKNQEHGHRQCMREENEIIPRALWHSLSSLTN